MAANLGGIDKLFTEVRAVACQMRKVVRGGRLPGCVGAVLRDEGLGRGERLRRAPQPTAPLCNQSIITIHHAAPLAIQLERAGEADVRH